MSSVKIDVESGFYTTPATVVEKTGDTGFTLDREWHIKVLNYSGRQPECHWDSTPSDGAKQKVDLHFGDCVHFVDK